MSTNKQPHTLRNVGIAAIWIVALAAAFVVVRPHLAAKVEPELLGDEFRHEEFKFAMRPPAGWVMSKMSPEQVKALSSQRPLLAVKFTGRRRGDMCFLTVYKTETTVRELAGKTLDAMPRALRDDVKQNFFDIDGLPAWQCEMTIREEVILHQYSLMVGRGEMRISLTYTAVETSFIKQRDAIRKSIKSLNFW